MRMLKTFWDNKELFSLLFFIILACFLPICFYQRPLGDGDIYAHIFFGNQLSNFNDLATFYEWRSSLSEPFGRYEYPYPIGLWIFGSAIRKTTGINTWNLALILPPTVFLVALMSAYCWLVRGLLKDKGVKHLPLIAFLFFVTVPSVTLNILQYATLYLGVILFLLIFSVIYEERMTLFKKQALFIFLTFILFITHGSTSAFILLILPFTFFLEFAMGSYNKDRYLYTVSLLLLYFIIVIIVPFRAYYTSAFSSFIEKVEGILPSIFSDIMKHALVDADLFSILLLIAAILTTLFIISCVGRAFKSIFSSIKYFSFVTFAALPRHAPRSPAMALFLLGPWQILLALYGLKDATKILKRETFALLVPMTLSILFLWSTYGRIQIYAAIPLSIISAIGWKRLDTLRLKNKYLGYIKKIFLLLILSTLLLSSVIGNLYYIPKFSGESYAVEGFSWIKENTPSDAICIALGYWYSINVIANRTNPMGFLPSDDGWLLQRNVRLTYQGHDVKEYFLQKSDRCYFIYSQGVERRVGGECHLHDLGKIYDQGNFMVFYLVNT